MPTKWKELLDVIIVAILDYVGKKGFLGYIYKKVLEFGGQALYDFVSEIYRKLKRSSEQKVAEDKKDEIIQKPDSTADEVGHAYEDYFNSGR